MHNFFSEKGFYLIDKLLHDQPDGFYELDSPKKISVFKYRNEYFKVLKNLNAGSFGRVDLVANSKNEEYVLKTMRVAAPTPASRNIVKASSESDLAKTEKKEEKGSKSAPVKRRGNRFDFQLDEIERKAHLELKVLQYLRRTPMKEIIHKEKADGESQSYRYFYILMDYCGIPLSDIIKDKQSDEKNSLTKSDFIDIAITLTEDLKKLHSLDKAQPGYFHGDLNPKNVLVLKNNNQFRACLVDFGSASSIEKKEVIISSELITKVKGTDTIVTDENMEKYFNGDYELVQEKIEKREERIQANHPRAIGTQGYADPNHTARSTKASEIYELGVVLAELFDFGKVKIDDEYQMPMFKLYKDLWEPGENIVYDSVVAMVSDDETNRPDLDKIIKMLEEQKEQRLSSAESASSRIGKLNS